MEISAAMPLPTHASHWQPVLTQHDIRAVVFDLDGTLIDSGADLLEGMRRTFRAHAVGELPASYQPQVLHGTMEGIMRTACRDMGWPVPGHLPQLLQHFVETFPKLGYPRTRLYDGVRDMLQALEHAGMALGVCTNSHSSSARLVLRQRGLLTRFGALSGADTWGAAKPSPVPLLQTLQVLGVEPRHCLYVGDTVIDAACAQAAQVRFAWFRGGYGDTDVDAQATFVQFADWPQLPAALAARAAS